MKRWIYRGADCDNPPILGSDIDIDEYVRVADILKVSPSVIGILARRGIIDINELDTFFSPSLRYLIPPEKWKGLNFASETLLSAIKDGRKVIVWGDYDVDGVTASALCYEVLSYYGIPIDVHLPDRMTEGYGLNSESITALLGDSGKKSILLTVDCGISNIKEVEVAKKLGAIVIVTDHHVPPEELPCADAIYDPKLTPGCPCEDLAGVGVAFFLMACINPHLSKLTGKPKKDLREVLDLVCLGTLADLVKITGQNRILVKNGLLRINDARRAGISELKRASGYDRAACVSSGQVSFNLAPRINAAGRLGSAMDAFKLLTKEYENEAPSLATKLDQMNAQRRQTEDDILREASEQVSAMLEIHPDLAGIVAYGTEWHSGVIGIVASRLVEIYARPTIVLCNSGEDGILKGSGRSVHGFDLYAGLGECADVIEYFGGHKMAAGLRIKAENLDRLRIKFHQVAKNALGDKVGIDVLSSDGILPFTLAVNMSFLKSLELMQPYGSGNPEPIFCSNKLIIKSIKRIGYGNDNFTFRVQEDDSKITLQAKLWRADKTKIPKEGDYVRIAFNIGINAYNGIETVELTMRDWEEA